MFHNWDFFLLQHETNNLFFFLFFLGEQISEFMLSFRTNFFVDTRVVGVELSFCFYFYTFVFNWYLCKLTFSFCCWKDFAVTSYGHTPYLCFKRILQSTKIFRKKLMKDFAVTSYDLSPTFFLKSTTSKSFGWLLFITKSITLNSIR